MKDQIDIIKEEIKALERELFPEYFINAVEETVEENILEEA